MPRKKPPARLCRIEVQFSEDEKRLIAKYAAELGVPIASVLRMAFKQWVAVRASLRPTAVGE